MSFPSSSTSPRLTQTPNPNPTPTQDAANACTELPNGGDVLVVGYRVVGGVAKRSITKLSLETGAEAWTATDFGDSAGSHGAWEGIGLTAAGDFAVLGGFYEKASTDEMAFRSYGNSGAKAVVMQLPVSALAGGSAPTSSSASWTTTWADRGTAKAVCPFTNGEVAVLLWTDDTSKATALVKLTPSGATAWGPLEFGATHGEGTELAVTADQSALFMTGHNDCDPSTASSGLCGKLSKIAAADGSLSWTQTYSSCGVPNECGYVHIKNECWGVLPMADGGAVLSCGTGIEDCTGMTFAGFTVTYPQLLPQMAARYKVYV